MSSRKELNNTNNEEFSTVFSDPINHKVATNKSKKSRLTLLISAVVAVAILAGGTVAVVKLVPDKKTDETSSFESIKVLNLKSDDYKSVSVKNSNGDFKFYSEKVEDKGASSSSSDSASTTTVKWYVDGYDKDSINESKTSEIAGSAADITAVREITTKNSDECGLNNPKLTVSVVTNDDGEFSIYIGDQSPDNMGTYLKLSNQDQIYIVSDEVTTAFEFDMLDLANTDAAPGITVTDEDKDYLDSDGKFAKFDSINISGTNFEQEVIITANPDKSFSEYAPYATVAPTKRIANNVDDLLKIFSSGIASNGAYLFKKTNEEISKLGLDKPDFKAILHYGKHSYTFMFKLMQDGDYAVLCDGTEMIKKVSKSNLPFISYGTNDFYAAWVCIQSIDDLSNFTVKCNDSIYSFDIEAKEDSDSKTSYTITKDGKNITAEYFQNFYQYCISLQCNDYTIDNITSSPDLTFIYTYKDTSRGTSTVEFRKSGETKYQYALDGIQMGKITSSSYNKIIKYLENISNGGDIK